MSLLKIAVENIPPSQRLEFGNSAKCLLLFVFYSCLSCPLVALLKVTYAENSHFVLSCRYYKAFIVNRLCGVTGWLSG